MKTRQQKIDFIRSKCQLDDGIGWTELCLVLQRVPSRLNVGESIVIDIYGGIRAAQGGVGKRVFYNLLEDDITLQSSELVNLVFSLLGGEE